jgi:hypothetical protein
MSSARVADGRRRVPARPRPASSTGAELTASSGRVYRIEDARRRAEAARAPVVDTRALLAEARIKWLEATLAIARGLGHAPPARAGGGTAVGGPRRWSARDTRSTGGAGRPGPAKLGGVEAIAWFGEAR